MPNVVMRQDGYTKIEEDHAVTDRAEHLDEVFNSRTRVVGDILERVMSLNETTADETDNPRPVEKVCEDIGQVCHAKHS